MDPQLKRRFFHNRTRIPDSFASEVLGVTNAGGSRPGPQLAYRTYVTWYLPSATELFVASKLTAQPFHLFQTRCLVHRRDIAWGLTRIQLGIAYQLMHEPYRAGPIGLSLQTKSGYRHSRPLESGQENMSGLVSQYLRWPISWILLCLGSLTPLLAAVSNGGTSLDQFYSRGGLIECCMILLVGSMGQCLLIQCRGHQSPHVNVSLFLSVVAFTLGALAFGQLPHTVTDLDRMKFISVRYSFSAAMCALWSSWESERDRP
jgi:hypothetical protein